MRKNTVVRHIGNGVCEVDLTRGNVALFDECDAENVSLFSWHSSRCNSSMTSYARGRMAGMSNQSGWQMHRMILCFPLLAVDHINGNGLDNRRCNLRLATTSENCRNIGIRNWPNKASKYKGVIRFRGGWRARICIHRMLIDLGFFEDELTASVAHDVASLRLHGSFGNRNHKDIEADAELIASVHRRIELKEAKGTFKGQPCK